MSSQRRVLVVAPSADLSAIILRCLSAAGHEAMRVTDFAAAKSEIDANPPDIIITEMRLGEFNGLHLAIRARARGMATRTMVIGEYDSVLKAEASRLDVPYLTTPLDELEFVTTLGRLIQEQADFLPVDAIGQLGRRQLP